MSAGAVRAEEPTDGESAISGPGHARGVGYALAIGALAGAIAGAVAGAIDGLWSWRDMGQFVPGAGARLRTLLYLATTHAFFAALIGAAVAGALEFYARFTHAGPLLRFALAEHRQRRASAPRDALAGLALALTVTPCLVAGLAGGFLYGNAVLASRKHMGLIIASSMIIVLFAVPLGVALGVALARPVERGLRSLARGDRLARWLSDERAPAIAASGLIALGGAVAVRASWQTLALLHLRPIAVVLLACLLAVPASAIARRWIARREPGVASERRGHGARNMAMVIGLASAMIITSLFAGSPEGVRKAVNLYSGLGGPLTRVLRAAGDLDGDGHSRILGGGDCDDWNAEIRPGAVEIPDDGIDQNCVGGDISLQRTSDEVGFAAVPPAVPPDFNVLFLTIDTLRADHLGAYGYQRPTTPRIDQIASSGALFVNAWAHAPSTRYSIPAILTGRYPLEVRYDHSIRGWPGLSPENVTLAEHMKSAGMTTGAILNYWYFDAHRRMNQGFDSYDNRNKRLHRGVPGKGPAETQGSSSKEQTDKAMEFIAEHADERFFLWVHYYDPHYRFELHPEVPFFGDDPIARYDNEIRFTDMHIGRLLDDLARRGLDERTIIVITGDHGEGFGEHGIEFHGYHLYAAQTRVPLIIRVPGLQPARVTTPAGHVDIVPTLANLAGLEPTPAMMGRSLVDRLAGRELDADRWIFQQLSYEGNHELRGAISKHCHVIYNVSPDTSWELYRVDRDPLEARDLIDLVDTDDIDDGVSEGSFSCRDARAVLEAWYDLSEIPEGAAEALLARAPAIERPLDLDLGDAVRLLAVELPTDPIRAGASFSVTYTFEARGTPPDGWKIFAHFEGERGGRFLGDHAPPRPFAWWRSGQYVRYAHTVTVPRNLVAGTYQLWFGLFRGAERQPARSAGSDAAAIRIVDDRANIGAVRVTR